MTGRGRIKKKLIFWLRCAQRFGLYHGTRISLRVLVGRGAVPIKVPGYRAPLIIRRGTSDADVFDDVIIRRNYSINCDDWQPAVIVDAGANTGLTSVFYAQLFPNARVLAIEPVEGNYRVLKSNIEAFPNVEAINAALWPTRASLTTANPNAEPWAFRMEEATFQNGDPITTISMNEVLEWAGARIDLFKIDIEGAEKQLFDAADLGWMEQVDSIVIELHDRIVPGSTKSFYRAVDSWVYEQNMTGEHLHIVRLNPMSACDDSRRIWRESCA